MVIRVIRVIRGWFPLPLSHWFERNHSHGTAGAIHDLQWRSDHYRAGQRQEIKIGEAGQSELAVAVHYEMIAEGWVETGGLPGVCADSLDADSENVALLGEQERGFPLP